MYERKPVSKESFLINISKGKWSKLKYSENQNIWEYCKQCVHIISKAINNKSPRTFFQIIEIFYGNCVSHLKEEKSTGESNSFLIQIGFMERTQGCFSCCI